MIACESTFEPHKLKPGEYCFYNRNWYAKTPNGLLTNLGNHTIEFDSDWLITVSPSILVTDGQGGRWHGYLENGIWSEE